MAACAARCNAFPSSLICILKFILHMCQNMSKHRRNLQSSMQILAEELLSTSEVICKSSVEHVGQDFQRRAATSYPASDEISWLGTVLTSSHQESSGLKFATRASWRDNDFHRNMFTNNIRNTSVSACLAIAASTYFCLSKIQGLASRSVPKPRAFMSRSGSLNNYGAWLSAKFKNHLEFEVCRHLCKVASSFNLTGTTNPVVTRKRLATVVPSFCHMPCQGMSAIDWPYPTASPRGAACLPFLDFGAMALEWRRSAPSQSSYCLSCAQRFRWEVETFWDWSPSSPSHRMILISTYHTEIGLFN